MSTNNSFGVSVCKRATHTHTQTFPLFSLLLSSSTAEMQVLPYTLLLNILECKVVLISPLIYSSSLSERLLFTFTSVASKLQQLLNPTAGSNPSSTVQLPFLIYLASVFSDSFLLLIFFLVSCCPVLFAF